MTDVKVEPNDYKSSEKFGGSVLAEALWTASLESWQDDEAGTTDTIGWYAIFHFNDEQSILLRHEPLGPNARVTVPAGSYVLETTSSGAVYASGYPLRGREVTELWQSILDDAAETHLSIPTGDETACGVEAAGLKTDPDINYVDCEECIAAHERTLRSYQ